MDHVTIELANDSEIGNYLMNVFTCNDNAEDAAKTEFGES